MKKNSMFGNLRTTPRQTAEAFRNAVSTLCHRFRNMIENDKDYKVISDSSLVRIEEHSISLSWDITNFDKTKMDVTVIRIYQEDMLLCDFGLNSLDYYRKLYRIEIRTFKGVLLNIMPEPFFYYNVEDDVWGYKKYTAIDSADDLQEITDAEINKILKEIFAD